MKKYKTDIKKMRNIKIDKYHKLLFLMICMISKLIFNKNDVFNIIIIII